MKADQKLVVYDGILMKCATLNGVHIPQESVSFDELIATIKDGMLNANSQTDKQDNRKNSHIGIQQQTPYKPFYRSQLRSDGEANVEDISLNGRSPLSRRTSSTSSGIPQSIIIPLRRKSSLSEGCCTSEDECFKVKPSIAKEARLLDQLHWMKTQGDDCVALENLKDIPEVVKFLRVLTGFTTPAALEFKLNQSGTITISYQFLHNFKNDYMMLKVKDNYCMFLSPF